MAGKKPTRILGISGLYHDAAAALLIDGVIVAAVQEERFTRIKHDAHFPVQAAEFCLRQAGITIQDIDYVVFYEKPLMKFERLLLTYMCTWPKGLFSFIKAMQSWLREKLWVEYLIAKKLGYNGEVLYVEHHYSHAASAYYASGCKEATVVTMDGVGEWDTTTIGYGKGNELMLTESIHFPHSLGLLYSAITYYLGFTVNSDEYKVMGLAPYGDPAVFREQFQKLMQVDDDGSFRLAIEYFNYEAGLTMTSRKLNELFGGSPRRPEQALEQRHKDIAAALQEVTNAAVLNVVRRAQRVHASENLCLAGGVALNCVANGKLLQSDLFKNVYVQPAAGDAGGAVGAACYAYFAGLGNAYNRSAMPTPYLGPEFADSEIEQSLRQAGLQYEALAKDALLTRIAQLIAEQKVVGWFQGRMEFGPRALGNRSILADPRRAENWQRVNVKVKGREGFRPLAPVVLAEHADDYFDLRGGRSPYMLFTAQVKSGALPAVTHVDGSARVQTIEEKDNPLLYALITEFKKQTGCPVLLNTSYNRKDEPIVCSPGEAIACFREADVDALVIGSCLVVK